MAVFSALVPLALRLEDELKFGWGLCVFLLSSILIAVPVFRFFGLYRSIFRYSGLEVVYALNKAIIVYTVLFVLLFTVVGVNGVPRSMGLAQPMLFAFLVMSSRLFAHYWLGGIGLKSRIQQARAVLIYGAGAAGRQLANSIYHSQELVTVGYVDDDERLHGQYLNGLQIFGPQDVAEVVVNKNVSEIYLALPSVARSRRNEIIALLKPLPAKVLTLPSLMDLTSGKVAVSDLTELDIEDLLGRESVAPSPRMLTKNITGKTVMVTGAGGSIGSELCRQIVKAAPAVLLLVEMTEFALYDIEHELQKMVSDVFMGNVQLVSLLANVRDTSRLDEILCTWKPHTIYHAAAYKHVPLVEYNPAEGVKNNVLGTLNAALLAAKHEVGAFVLISTDKAVRPTNVMGASKRLAEMILQAQALLMSESDGKTCFSMVRFGNVLGSSGSVVPLFRRQIKDGGPITLTDERITRYFMTIPEAAQLVIQAGAMASGGDVFVLDMGDPVKIADLAKRLIELSGLSVREDANPNGDIEIKVTGLRPGEKLYEELLIGDNPLPTAHSRIMKAREDFLPWDVLQAKLSDLELALDSNDVPLILAKLKDLVPGYQTEGLVADWVWLTCQQGNKEQR